MATALPGLIPVTPGHEPLRMRSPSVELIGARKRHTRAERRRFAEQRRQEEAEQRIRHREQEIEARAVRLDKEYAERQRILGEQNYKQQQKYERKQEDAERMRKVAMRMAQARQDKRQLGGIHNPINVDEESSKQNWVFITALLIMIVILFIVTYCNSEAASAIAQECGTTNTAYTSAIRAAIISAVCGAIMLGVLVIYLMRESIGMAIFDW